MKVLNTKESKLYRKAAKVMLEHGFTVGTHEDVQTGEVCLLGACTIADGRKNTRVRPHFGDEVEGDETGRLWSPDLPVLSKLVKKKEPFMDWISIDHYNDSYLKRKDNPLAEAIAVLLEASVLAEKEGK
jgi:hypothetical protein